MDINNPEAIRFVNEVQRPICERIRTLHSDITAIRAAYDGSIGLHFAMGQGREQTDPIVDGRDAEGISRLTRSDALAFVDVVLYQLKALLEAPGVPAIISKPCVRFTPQ